jgi:opacity protein-like surface antigen
VSKLLLAGIVFGALIAPAIAADMQIKARPRVPPLAWSGFYAGLNVGYADPQNGVITAANPTPDVALGVVSGVSEGLATLSSGSMPTRNGTGFAGGGQVGYNAQLGKLLIAGAARRGRQLPGPDELWYFNGGWSPQPQNYVTLLEAPASGTQYIWNLSDDRYAQFSNHLARIVINQTNTVVPECRP